MSGPARSVRLAMADIDPRAPETERESLQRQEISRHPHDGLFKHVVGRPDQAAALFRCELPVNVVEAIDWSTLAPAPTNVVDELLRQGHRDLLFQARLHGGTRA